MGWNDLGGTLSCKSLELLVSNHKDSETHSCSADMFERVNTGTHLPFIALKALAPCLLTPAHHGSMSYLEAGWGNKQNIGCVWKWLLMSLPVCSELWAECARAQMGPVVQRGVYANPSPGWCAIITCDYCTVQLMSQPGMLTASETSLHPAHLSWPCTSCFFTDASAFCQLYTFITPLAHYCKPQIKIKVS